MGQNRPPALKRLGPLQAIRPFNLAKLRPQAMVHSNRKAPHVVGQKIAKDDRIVLRTSTLAKGDLRIKILQQRGQKGGDKQPGPPKHSLTMEPVYPCIDLTVPDSSTPPSSQGEPESEMAHKKDGNDTPPSQPAAQKPLLKKSAIDMQSGCKHQEMLSKSTKVRN